MAMTLNTRRFPPRKRRRGLYYYVGKNDDNRLPRLVKLNPFNLNLIRPRRKTSRFKITSRVFGTILGALPTVATEIFWKSTSTSQIYSVIITECYHYTGTCGNQLICDTTTSHGTVYNLKSTIFYLHVLYEKKCLFY